MSDSDSDGETVKRAFGIRKSKDVTLYGSRRGQKTPRFHALAEKLAKKDNRWGDSSSDDEYEPPTQEDEAAIHKMEMEADKIIDNTSAGEESKESKEEDTNPFQAQPVSSENSKLSAKFVSELKSAGAAVSSQPASENSKICQICSRTQGCRPPSASI